MLVCALRRVVVFCVVWCLPWSRLEDPRSFLDLSRCCVALVVILCVVLLVILFVVLMAVMLLQIIVVALVMKNVVVELMMLV